MEEQREIKSMIRLREMAKLGDDVNAVLCSIAKLQDVYVKCGRYGKRWRDKYTKQASQVGLKGLKVLNKKIPIYVELPKLEETSVGCRETRSNSNEEVHHISDIPQEARERLKAIEAEILGQIAYEEQQDKGPQKPSGD